MWKCSIVAALLLGGTAHADSYVSAGIASGEGYTVDWLYAGPQLEAGVRGNDHTWLHAAAALIGRAGYGTTQDLTIQLPQDNVVETRAGLEWRCAARPTVCWFAGLDVGYHTGTMTIPGGVVVVPRGGIDVRLADALRLRLGAELRASNTEPDSDAPFSFGIGGTAGVLYAF
jgi:hypothetical protein